jgi:CHASE2 domain-containing sensor protein
MLIEWSQFTEQHWIVIVIGCIASLLWFIAGRQSVSDKRSDSAIFWTSIAVVLILMVCGWAVVQKEWLGLAFALAVLCLEVLWVRRWVRRIDLT